MGFSLWTARAIVTVIRANGQYLPVVVVGGGSARGSECGCSLVGVGSLVRVGPETGVGEIKSWIEEQRGVSGAGRGRAAAGGGSKLGRSADSVC